MTEEKIVKALNESWAMETGFFYELRTLRFNPTKGKKLYKCLMSFNFGNQSEVSKELVRLLWYIPLFMEYQKPTLKTVLKEIEYKKYVKLSNVIQGEVERLLGYP